MCTTLSHIGQKMYHEERSLFLLIAIANNKELIVFLDVFTRLVKVIFFNSPWTSAYVLGATVAVS